MASLLDKLVGKDGTESGTEIGSELGPEFSDQSEEEFARDPEPSPEIPESTVTPITSAGRKARTSSTAARRPGRPTNMEKEVVAELEAYAELFAMAWSTRDPECAGVLDAQSAEIAKRIARILRRYPHVMAKFHASGLIGDWTGLGMAVLPVLRAVWSHHIAKPLDDEERLSSDDYAAGAGAGYAADRYPAYIPRASAVGGTGA